MSGDTRLWPRNGKINRNVSEDQQELSPTTADVVVVVVEKRCENVTVESMATFPLQVPSPASSAIIHRSVNHR